LQICLTENPPNVAESDDDDEKDKTKEPKDPVSDENFDIIKYLIQHGAKVHFEETDLPSRAGTIHLPQSSPIVFQEQQQFGRPFGTQGGSERSMLRNSVEQPLTLVSAT